MKAGACPCLIFGMGRTSRLAVPPGSGPALTALGPSRRGQGCGSTEIVWLGGRNEARDPAARIREWASLPIGVLTCGAAVIFLCGVSAFL